MMRSLFRQEGANLSVDIVTDPDVRRFISSHAEALDSSFSQVDMSDSMRRHLQQSDYIFSGMKTFHELNEAFPSLIDENGVRKPFEQFLNDVQKIDNTYNRNYLRAEYNFAHASAQMASRWEQFAADGDRYNLQYRTANDGSVRPEHAALHGVTLPPSDPFWQSYFPPNGWNCRCTAVQVLKDKYPETPHDEAEKRAANALSRDHRGMFRFNPGIQRKTFPDYNPYTISRCRDCDIAKGKLSLAKVPENEICAACRLVHSLEKQQEPVPASRSQVIRAQKELVNWYKQNLPEDMEGKFQVKRFKVDTTDGLSVIVNRKFYKETINKYQDDILYTLKLEYAKKAHFLITKATLTNPNEPSKDHPGETFRVYNYVDDCYRVEMKVRCNKDGNYLHILRAYKK